MARPGIDVITAGKLKDYLQGWDESDAGQTRLLATIINIMGGAFERHLKRYIYATERSETFDVNNSNHLEYFPHGVPISAVTGYYDTGRDFDDAIDSDDCIVGPDSMSVLLVNQYAVQESRMSLKLTYTGGMATSTMNISVVMTATPTGTFAAGDALLDGSDAAIGTCVSYSATTLVLVWTPTPTSTTFDEDTGGQAVGGTIKTAGAVKTGTIASFSTSNLLYDYPDLMAAALAQAEYTFRRKDQIGTQRVEVLGETVSYLTKARALCPEALELLAPLKVRTL